ncbi:hypothetical protein AHF37_03457 [Paragonimus kellicotti]|nr:hypothetical protein AHF37_03457 [Paragonimus kellicotti]
MKEALVSSVEVQGQLDELNVTKLAGLNGIPTVILRPLADVLHASLATLFDKSPHEAKLDAEWKVFIVTPIHKEGNTE